MYPFGPGLYSYSASISMSNVSTCTHHIELFIVDSIIRQAIY